MHMELMNLMLICFPNAKRLLDYRFIVRLLKTAGFARSFARSSVRQIYMPVTYIAPINNTRHRERSEPSRAERREAEEG